MYKYDKETRAQTALVIMAKKPLVGAAKTRLCPPLTPQEAALTYEALLLDTIHLCSGLDGIQLAVAVTPPVAVDYFSSITPAGTVLLPAACTDIGGCLEKVIGQLFQSGYTRVLALNSDGPSLPVGFLYQALDLLDNHEVVLGPGEDCGYYLIGQKQLHLQLFTGIHWSTARVLPQTLAIIESLGLDAALLPEWYDIDDWEDLLRLKRELDELPPEALPNTRRLFSQREDFEPVDGP